MFKVLATKMNETKMSDRFTSYVGISDNTPEIEECLPKLQLVKGEMLIFEARKVLMFAPVSEQRQGRSGSLCVTNFKLAFLSTHNSNEAEDGYSRGLLGPDEECLSNIDIVFQIMGDDKKRRLPPASVVSGRVKGLHVLCKNMRAMSFSFKHSPVDHGKSLANALLHYSYPKHHQLLFTYDYRDSNAGPIPALTVEPQLFREPSDWLSELAASGCAGWRVSAANQSYQLSDSLPQWLVVPQEVLDWQLGEVAGAFRANRPPVWVWGTPQGAALVRMADVVPTLTDRSKENSMLESVRKSHPRIARPTLLCLDRLLPSTKDIMTSFVKLRELCAPESVRQFWTQDNHYLSLLESSQWLSTVARCLARADDVAAALLAGTSVVLQEGEGRDLSAVVSSLAQLLLDERFRTVRGLAALVQKEWVALGHPFCTRLAHVLSDETERSPVFLVFLHCVWQLTRQFPTAFQFSERMLVALWDSCHVTLFDTFLFDCENKRAQAVADGQKPLVSRPVWPALASRGLRNESYEAGCGPLRAATSLALMAPWPSAFFRFVPLLDIPQPNAVAAAVTTRQAEDAAYRPTAPARRSAASSELLSRQRAITDELKSRQPIANQARPD